MKLSKVTNTCFAVFFALSLYACAQSKKSEGTKVEDKIENGLVSPGQLEKLLSASVQLIDVRTPEEFAEGHLAGAININFYSDDFEGQLAALDKQAKIAVYCAVGGRSGRAYKKLLKLDFANTYDLDGGIKAWKNSGRSVEK